MPGSAASVIASHRGPLAARGAAATMTAAMRVIEQRRTFVHTHFVTDGERLPSDRVREIERGVLPVLRALGIVFGIHLAPPTPPGGIEIVLECIPAEPEMRRIEQTLTRVLAPIPVRPPVTGVAQVTAPE